MQSLRFMEASWRLKCISAPVAEGVRETQAGFAREHYAKPNFDVNTNAWFFAAAAMRHSSQLWREWFQLQNSDCIFHHAESRLLSRRSRASPRMALAGSRTYGEASTLCGSVKARRFAAIPQRLAIARMEWPSASEPAFRPRIDGPDGSLRAAFAGGAR
jgi:hypothetical protein